MTLNLRKIVLLLGYIILLLEAACALYNTKICRKRNGHFPRPGTLCKGYYVCKNFVPMEKTCSDGEHFNAMKERCDWAELYPCFEKPKDKECLRETGLFLKPGTDCKKYYRCCNGKAKEEACSGDLLFDPSKGNCEWPDLYTCIESVSTTQKVSSTVSIASTSTPRPKTSTDPAISKSTIQKTTTSNRIISSTHDPVISTKSDTETTPNEGRSTFQTDETSAISQTITNKISTSRPTAEISTTLEPKETSTTTEISTYQSKITEISTLQPTTTEVSTSQPTTEISTAEPTTEISTTEPTTEISTTEPTTEISTTEPTTEISTTEPTTELSTTQPTSGYSTTRLTTSEISRISQTISPQMSSTHSTDHTILKENKEGDLTTPVIFETTFLPSTVESTPFDEGNIMCPEPDGYFPHPTNKHKFIGCVSNIAYVLTCPSDLVYKHHLRRCDHE